MKKILCGAGHFGSLAIDYIGSEDVAYFVSNSPEQAGTRYCGKEVLSFDNYLKIARQYRTIITLFDHQQFEKQLTAAGIRDYSIFFAESSHSLMSLRNHNIDPDGSYALYGADGLTEYLVRDLLRCGVKADNIRYIRSDIPGYDTEVAGLRELSLAEAIRELPTIVLASAHNTPYLLTRLYTSVPCPIRIINPFYVSSQDSPELIRNPYDGRDPMTTEADWNRLNSANRQRLAGAIQTSIAEWYRYPAMFQAIEIETINRCNGVCSFCPVNAADDPRPKAVMSESLFRKIIGELSGMNYAGTLALFSNNEPFLDERISEFCRYAKAACPNARVFLFTNGTLLTLEKFLDVIDSLDRLTIDNYNQGLRLIQNARIIADYCESRPELKRKVTIVLRKSDEILSSRGGDAPNRKDILSYPEASCVLPFRQMVVRPDGKLSLCCNDPFGRCTLGDLNRQTVREAWFGEPYQQVRAAIRKGRASLGHCVNCDVWNLKRLLA